MARNTRHYSFSASVQRQVALIVALFGLVLGGIVVFSAATLPALALGALATVVVCGAAAALLSGSIVRPLRALDARAAQAAEGDLTRIPAPAGRNEIAGIAASLNSLIRDLRDRTRAVDDLQAVERRARDAEAKVSELQLSYDHIVLVSEMGQDVAASLRLDDILLRLYEGINSMMDAAVFAVGVYDESAAQIDFTLSIERGARQAPYTIPMGEKNRFSVWCIENGKEVFLNDIHRDFARYVRAFDSPIGRPTGSLIALPMFAKKRPIGVILVQSFRTDAYTTYHLDVLKSLALYTGAALENAKAYEALDSALRDLRAAQQQLVQAEKLSSLGLLTAGIAHEINNPINFVSANVSPLRRDIGELTEVLDRFVAAADGAAGAKAIAEAAAAARGLDVGFVVGEIHKLLDGIEEGASRTAEIVRGLRNFSRLDESDVKPADLHEGLDSTLMLLRNKSKGRIEIVREYGDIPKVECYPGQINQVFMNLLSNAVQAIPETGTIRIATRALGERVEIRIRDSGVGMSEDVRAKIFDPFFTTKDVGIGTGLGLSITYGIIQKHGGHIEVDSAPERGTEFTINLPIRQPRIAAGDQAA